MDSTHRELFDFLFDRTKIRGTLIPFAGFKERKREMALQALPPTVNDVVNEIVTRDESRSVLSTNTGETSKV